MPTFSRAAERFLSTPSARRATQTTKQGEKDWDISIHALREEGDMLGSAEAANEAIFLSTPSARRATRYPCAGVRLHLISIHALREEGDDGAIQSGDSSTDFYPRPPRGGRRLR